MACAARLPGRTSTSVSIPPLTAAGCSSVSSRTPAPLISAVIRTRPAQTHCTCAAQRLSSTTVNGRTVIFSRLATSFSRALLADLRHQMSDEEFDRSLGSAIDEIYQASTTKAAA